MMDKLVVSGSMNYLKCKYAHEFKSSKWAVTEIKEWSDGKYTYVFEWVGE